MSYVRSSDPAVRASTGEPVVASPRPPDGLVEDPPEHRKRTSRQVRHESRARLHQIVGDEEALEDADLLCPTGAHDIGRKTSPAPRHEPKPGRRDGFKVWKTTFWKRRHNMRSARNAAARRLATGD